MRAKAPLAVCALALAFVSACGGAKAPDSRYPARKEGCDVKLFHDAPTMSTDNIGPVMASCSPDVADGDCVRQLQDEACKLGGDVVWGVPDKPTMDGGKNLWFGRAAHTKAAPAPATSATPAYQR
jgi:hypothetical protein